MESVTKKNQEEMRRAGWGSIPVLSRVVREALPEEVKRMNPVVWAVGRGHKWLLN